MNRRQALIALIVVVLLGTVAVSQVAVGNFNAATGFSGRHGFTCTSCHTVAGADATDGNGLYDPPAEVALTGLPSEWDLGTQYQFTITVTGGPPAAPAPAPQGGFEIESNTGKFSVPSGMESFIEVYAENGAAVTYTAEGTLMREWDVSWNSPSLTGAGQGGVLNRAPDAAMFWVAGMSANGNHVVSAGASDGGELGDSVHNITVQVPPSAATMTAWQESRLSPPDVSQAMNVFEFDVFAVEGSHTDSEATHIGYSFQGGAWERAASSTKWSIPFGNGLTAGDYELLVRSENDERQSDSVRIAIHVEELDYEGQPAPMPITIVFAALFLAIGWSRKW